MLWILPYTFLIDHETPCEVPRGRPDRTQLGPGQEAFLAVRLSDLSFSPDASFFPFPQNGLEKPQHDSSEASQVGLGHRG